MCVYIRSRYIVDPSGSVDHAHDATCLHLMLNVSIHLHTEHGKRERDSERMTERIIVGRARSQFKLRWLNRYWSSRTGKSVQPALSGLRS